MKLKNNISITQMSWELSSPTRRTRTSGRSRQSSAVQEKALVTSRKCHHSKSSDQSIQAMSSGRICKSDPPSAPSVASLYALSWLVCSTCPSWSRLWSQTGASKPRDSSESTAASTSLSTTSQFSKIRLMPLGLTIMSRDSGQELWNRMKAQRWDKSGSDNIQRLS